MFWILQSQKIHCEMLLKLTVKLFIAKTKLKLIKQTHKNLGTSSKLLLQKKKPFWKNSTDWSE